MVLYHENGRVVKAQYVSFERVFMLQLTIVAKNTSKKKRENVQMTEGLFTLIKSILRRKKIHLRTEIKRLFI